MMLVEREDLAAKGTNVSFAMTLICAPSATMLVGREEMDSTRSAIRCSVY